MSTTKRIPVWYLKHTNSYHEVCSSHLFAEWHSLNQARAILHDNFSNIFCCKLCLVTVWPKIWPQPEDRAIFCIGSTLQDCFLEPTSCCLLHFLQENTENPFLFWYFWDTRASFLCYAIAIFMIMFLYWTKKIFLFFIICSPKKNDWCHLACSGLSQVMEYFGPSTINNTLR